MQLNLRFSPLTTGLAFLPLTGLLVLTSVTVQTRVLPRTGAKPVLMTGMGLGLVAMILFTRLTPTSGRGSLNWPQCGRLKWPHLRPIGC